MRICLDKSIIGTSRHLIWEDGIGYYWTNRVSEETWALGLPGRVRDLGELAHAMGTELTWSPPPAHERSFRELLGEEVDLSGIRWSCVLPHDLYLQQIREIFLTSQKLLRDSADWNYLTTFESTQRVLCGLAPVFVDQSKIDAFLWTIPEGHQKDIRRLRKGGRVIYSRRTSTGRLTIQSGPQLLTLDKRYRIFLKSRYGADGHLIQLDYVSLEPRVLLALTGQSAPEDVYEILSDRVPVLSRDNLKGVTMTILYGGNLTRLQSQLPVEVNAVAVMDQLREIFHLRALEDRLRRDYEVSGLLSNHYGRVIILRRQSSSYLVSAYVQSTAVDVALLGFDRICQELRKVDGIDPFAVIHDSLWLDVHRDVAGYIRELIEVGEKIPGFNLRFPLAVRKING